MHVVIEAFTDARDDRHIYRAGDPYPRPGYKPGKTRVRELEGAKNARGRPRIKAVSDNNNE